MTSFGGITICLTDYTLTKVMVDSIYDMFDLVPIDVTGVTYHFHKDNGMALCIRTTGGYYDYLELSPLILDEETHYRIKAEAQTHCAKMDLSEASTQ
jgi:hypothetical protein